MTKFVMSLLLLLLPALNKALNPLIINQLFKLALGFGSA